MRIASMFRIASMVLALVIGIAAPAGAQSENVRPLVDAEWLMANAGQATVVVLDIRDNIEGTDLGTAPYIEGAVVAPYASAGWLTEIDGVPGMLPPVEAVSGLIGNLGIDNDDHVVIVPWGTDSTEFGSATRVYWTFKYLGHHAVSILDGGWRQYDAAGPPRSATAAEPQPAAFAYELQDELLATTESTAGQPSITRARRRAPWCAPRATSPAPSTSSTESSTAANTRGAPSPKRSGRWRRGSASARTRRTLRFATPATGPRSPGLP